VFLLVLLASEVVDVDLVSDGLGLLVVGVRLL